MSATAPLPEAAWLGTLVLIRGNQPGVLAEIVAPLVSIQLVESIDLCLSPRLIQKDFLDGDSAFQTSSVTYAAIDLKAV